MNKQSEQKKLSDYSLNLKKSKPVIPIGHLLGQLSIFSVKVTPEIVLTYIEDGLLPIDKSLKKLLDEVTTLSDKEKHALYNAIPMTMPQDSYGESIVRCEEWYNFLSNPLAPQPLNLLDKVKQRAEEIYAVLPDYELIFSKKSNDGSGPK